MPRASFINLLNLVAKCTVNIAVSAAPQCPTSTVFVRYYMKQISSSASKLVKNKLKYVFDKLQDLGKVYGMDASENGDNDVVSNDLIEEYEAEEKEIAFKSICLIIKSLSGKLFGYCEKTPILSFCGSRYDINLVKSKLAEHLNLHIRLQILPYVYLFYQQLYISVFNM